VVAEGDEVLAIRSSGQVTRSQVSDVSSTGRDTMGVKFVDVRAGDEVVAIARNADADVEELQEATVHDTGVMPQPVADDQEPG
jgi:DNA gyrase subunit A